MAPKIWERKVKIMADFTQAQKSAIETLDANVSVSAGAGSGKTRVLVEHFVKIIVEQKAFADEILAITFTKKAAKEMRERIRKTLYALLDSGNNAEKIFWQEQLHLLEKAQISTIDSFCSKLIRDNPVEAGMDPNFQVREEYELEDFHVRVIKEFMVQNLQENDTDFMKLMDNYEPARLATMLISLIDKLPQVLCQDDLAEPYLARVKEEENLKVEVLASFSNLIALKDTVGGKTAQNLLALEASGEELRELIAERKYDFLSQFTVGLRASGKVKEEIKAFKNAVLELSNFTIDLAAVEVIASWDKVLRKLYSYLKQAVDVQEYYSFDDIAAKAVSLLDNYPHILQKAREKYKYIMVDEFQDTNECQKELVYLLAGSDKKQLHDNRLFVVGDAKQSIYRFRGADVSVFKKVRDDIEQLHGTNVVLADNFRSTPEIMAACNCLFKDLLGGNPEDDVTFQELHAHKESDAKPFLITIETQENYDKKADASEAIILARHIRKIVEEKADIAYKDVAILLPAINLAARFAKALRAEGIDYKILDGKGFYERQEILDVVNLLSFLLNSRRDMELAGILRSPYFGIDDAVLTNIFQAKAERTLWEYIETEGNLKQQSFWKENELLRKAYEKLSYLRKVAKILSLPELFKEIYATLKVSPLLLAQEFGQEKLANVNKLKIMAGDFAMQQGGNSYEFLQRIKLLRQAGAREGAALVQNNADAVNIMTIHKSKGLEFPVVYLPALQTKGNSDRDSIKFLPQIGLGIQVRDASGELMPSYVYTKVKEENSRLEDCEKIRQLYVAMTRAESYLFLSGVKNVAANKNQDKKENWFEAVERLFAAGSGNENLLNLETYCADEVDASQEDIVHRSIFSINEEVYKQIRPLDSLAKATVNSLSASTLQQYDICPRRYYYEQVMQMPMVEPEVTGESENKIPPYLLGLVIHSALELSKSMEINVALSLALKKQEVPSYLLKSTETVAGKMLSSYCAGPLYLDNKALPQEVEKEFSLPFFAIDGQDIYFRGSIDCLVHYPDASLGIIDYKTGRPPILGEEKTGYTRQLVIYALAAEKLFKQPVKMAQLHFLQNNTIWELQLPIDEEVAKLKTLCAEIKAKKEEEDFAVQPQNCSYCVFKYFCPRK